jgi:membrane-associated protease RseP (regulator of RpoE activity)
MNIGSLGAVIRIRQVPDSRRKFFDIGVAGPLAGFVVSVGLLIYGFATLPDKEAYIYQIHPYYAEAGHVLTGPEVLERYPGAMVIEVGSNLLYTGLAHLIPADISQVPPPSEMMHYPFLFVGFLTLFFTAMNLLPIGQLDGGHVMYGLFGPKIAGVVSRVAVLGLLMIGGTGVAKVDAYCAPLYGDSFGLYMVHQIGALSLYAIFLVFIIGRIFRDWPLLWKVGAAFAMLGIQFLINLLVPGIQPYGLWLLYAFLAVRMIGLDHPVTQDEAPLSLGRKVLAWLAIIIFILCFTPFPLSMPEIGCPSLN